MVPRTLKDYRPRDPLAHALSPLYRTPAWKQHENTNYCQSRIPASDSSRSSGSSRSTGRCRHSQLLLFNEPNQLTLQQGSAFWPVALFPHIGWLGAPVGPDAAVAVSSVHTSTTGQKQIAPHTRKPFLFVLSLRANSSTKDEP